MAYDIGDLIAITARFRDGETGNPVDPDTVTCKVKDPAGIVTTFTGGEVAKVGAGRYRVAVPVTAHGGWTYRFEGDGAHVGAVEGTFTVRETAF